MTKKVSQKMDTNKKVRIIERDDPIWDEAFEVQEKYGIDPIVHIMLSGIKATQDEERAKCLTK